MSASYPTVMPPGYAQPARNGEGDAVPTRLPPTQAPAMEGAAPFQRYAPAPTAQPMKILYGSPEGARPFEEAPRAPRGFSGDYWGAFSLETFADVGGLTYTHEDAGGWLSYLEQFQPANFWYKDGNVMPWAYYEDYDNWLDTYGMDAVLAVYHSGHGGMDGAGKFSAPLGADWGGLGTTAVSDRMRLGNEQANYIFWSTCLSLRVLEGHNPIRTWSPANLGFRMLFGFETVSWDDPNYGKFFWEEWNKEKSLSTAWLDASWRIAHDQAPSVVACGATAAEAQNRLYNERHLSWEHVSQNWWWWRWYYAATAALATRDPSRALPKQLLVAELAPVRVDDRLVRGVIDRIGVSLRVPDEVTASRDGSFVLREGSARVAFGGDGSFEAQIASGNAFNRQQLDVTQAGSIAQDALRRYGLDREVALTFDRVRLSAEGGGSTGASGRMEGPYVIGTTVQFRQVINDLPVLTPGVGEVRISIDNDGTVTGVQSSTRAVAQLHDRPRNTTNAPLQEGPIARANVTEDAGYERLLAAEWRKRLTAWVVRGEAPAQYTIVPGSTEIGYDIRGNQAIIVARRAIEVDLGRGYRKRYWLTVPIIE
jgi:hypothetical protein